MKKLLILCSALLALSIAHAQFPNVSTGITLSGSTVIPLPPNTPDPNWKIIAPSAIPPGPTYIEPYVVGFWQPTPIVTPPPPTNAGWINPTTTQGQDVPGDYWFERKFSIPAGTGSFSCNFKVAYDDNVPISLYLVPPIGPPIPLTVVPTTAYHLSKLITTRINCPQDGEWSIRARVTYIDGLGGFLLSGRIDTSKSGCDNGCNCKLTNSVTTNAVKKTINCGDTVLLACGTTNKFAPILDCSGDGSVHLQSIKLVDINGYTPSWASASFFTNLGNGNLVVPAGVSGVFTLTYSWGRNCQTCGSCSYVLKIQCQTQSNIPVFESNISYSQSNVSKPKAQVYPNPFTNDFTLKLPVNEVADVQLVNLQGVTLEKKTKTSGTLQMGKQIAYGAYRIQIIYNDGTTENLNIIKSPN